MHADRANLWQESRNASKTMPAITSHPEQTRPHGCKISPNSFCVTTTLSDIGYMGKPPAIERTLN
jgi:hypothetical protein